MHISSANFIKSASKLAECPPADFQEFALVGRSNVGKSTLINMITQRKGLAKSSVTPGKTQLLNYFLINQNWYLVDLPGYGYAKYSKEQRIQWMDTMQEYLSQRDTLRKVFVLIDGSISPQKIDMDFLTIFAQEKIPYDIIITKTDKCNQKELHKNLTALKEQIEETLGGLPNIIQTSSIKGRGRNEILDYIENLLN